MYAEYKGRKEIVLWCYSKADAQKRSAESPSSNGKEKKASTGYTTHQEKIQKVQETVDELGEGMLESIQKKSYTLGRILFK